MTANGLPHDGDELAFQHAISTDERVRDEFDQLNRFLEEIDDHPLTETPTQSDPAWRIEDQEVSRWRILVQGNTRLDRIARFRSELQRREDIIDARVERFDGGEIAIRLVTTGGIPMGPLERAVWSLTRGSGQITQDG